MKTERIATGYSALSRLEFVFDFSSSVCSLVLELAEDESPSSKKIRVKCFDVSQLYLKDFGSGLTQVQILMVEDISGQQLDRIKYLVREVENENISFGCRQFSYEGDSGQ